MYVNARAIIERTGPEGVEILLQTRDKPGERQQLELPGGQVEPYESLVDALRREVLEETGLTVDRIEGQDTRVVTVGEQATVECLRPLATYQTLEGPVDSMGVYFRCSASGRLMSQGDGSKAAQWVSPAQLRSWMDADIERFSWVDRAGLRFYLDAALEAPVVSGEGQRGQSLHGQHETGQRSQVGDR